MVVDVYSNQRRRGHLRREPVITQNRKFDDGVDDGVRRRRKIKYAKCGERMRIYINYLYYYFIIDEATKAVVQC